MTTSGTDDKRDNPTVNELYYLAVKDAAFESIERSKDELIRLTAAACAEKLSEVLTPSQAAHLLGITERTLSENHKKWGLTKSVALGHSNPRYFRSQIMERMKALAIVPLNNHGSTKPRAIHDVASGKGVVAA